MRAAIYRATLRTGRFYDGAVTSRVDFFSHFATRFNRSHGSPTPSGDQLGARELEALFNFRQLSIGQAELTTD